MSSISRALDLWTIWLTAKGADGRLGMVAVPGGQLLGDPVQPFVEQALRPRVQRREGADDPRLALGDDEIGIGDDEQGRADRGQAQAVEQGRKAHAACVMERSGGWHQPPSGRTCRRGACRTAGRAPSARGRRRNKRAGSRNRRRRRSRQPILLRIVSATVAIASAGLRAAPLQRLQLEHAVDVELRVGEARSRSRRLPSRAEQVDAELRFGALITQVPASRSPTRIRSLLNNGKKRKMHGPDQPGQRQRRRRPCLRRAS